MNEIVSKSIEKDQCLIHLENKGAGFTSGEYQYKNRFIIDEIKLLTRFAVQIISVQVVPRGYIMKS